MSDTHTAEGYFQEYRNKLQQLESVKQIHREMHDKAERELSDIREKYNKTLKEINDMRKVITLIVDNGLDPVEAKLTVDNYPHTDSIWSSTAYDYPINETNITSPLESVIDISDVIDSFTTDCSMTGSFSLKY